MDYEAILFDVNDGIAVITLNRPERMNTFSDALLSAVSYTHLTLPTKA